MRQHRDKSSVALAFKFGYLLLCQLDQMCLDRRPSLGDVTTTDSQKQNIQAILGLLEQSDQADQSTPALTALHLIASAMDGINAVLCAFIT